MSLSSREFAQALLTFILDAPQISNDYDKVALHLQRYSGREVKAKKIHYLKANESLCPKWLIQIIMTLAIRLGWLPQNKTEAEAAMRTIGDGHVPQGNLADIHRVAEAFLVSPLFDEAKLSELDYPSSEQIQLLVQVCENYEKSTS